MKFASPELLVALLLVPLAIGAYLFVQRRRQRYVVRFTNVDLLSNLAPRVPAWRRHVPALFYIAAISALAVALARPSMVLAVPREEATILLTMDVSGSMQATDVDPSRLAAAQKSAREFLDRLPNAFRVGLVAFSTDARIIVEPTTDRAQLRNALDQLTAGGGTALGDAVVLSLQAAGLDVTAVPSATPQPGGSASPSATPTATPESPDPSASPSSTPTPSEPPLVAVVLLSDGANSTGRTQPLDAAQRAAAVRVPVYTIALGTNDGVVQVPDRTGQLRSLLVPPDPETLAQIAEITGGRSFEAPSASDLDQVYQSLGSRIGYMNEEREVTQLFAGAALAFVLAGGGLAAHWFNRLP
jgi:Ca-activated chloride channel family protein